jgi:hypothetical protein
VRSLYRQRHPVPRRVAGSERQEDTAVDVPTGATAIGFQVRYESLDWLNRKRDQQIEGPGGE